MRFPSHAAAWTLCATLLSSCSLMTLNDQALFNARTVQTTHVMIIVDSSVAASLRTELATWKTDLAADNISVDELDWSDPSPFLLRTALKEQYKSSSLNGAFLVGNVPSPFPRSIENVALLSFATATSNLPSPLKSPIAAAFGELQVA